VGGPGSVIALPPDRSTAREPSVAYTWGSTPAERELRFACDSYLVEPDSVCFRAISVRAPAAVVFRWLCQLRATPYSYDWLDNLGRGSPQTLTPGLEQLELGQTLMTMFELVEFERDRHITLLAHRFRWVFGDVCVTYLVAPSGEADSRIVVKLLGRFRTAPGRLLLKPTMPWLDLFMMRRQLLNLKGLAERDARAG